MLTLSELVAAVYLKATGKRSSLIATDTKYLKIRDIANGYIRTWQNTKGVDWSSLYEKDHSLGTVTATGTYDLDDDIRKLSDTRGDFVQITDTNNSVTNYEIVPADTLKQYAAGALVCAQIGRTLVFVTAFTSADVQFGGTITAPVYLYAEEMTSANSEVPVDIPDWLVLISSAEYVRNDITKQNQYPNLVQEANELMDRMIDDNEAQVSQVFIDVIPVGRTW